MAVGLYHLTITLPSTIYHSCYDMYYRVTSQPLILDNVKNKKVVIFVHGRGGHYSNFTPIIEQLEEKLQGEYYLFPIDLGDNSDTSVDEDVFNLQHWLDYYQDCEITLVGLSKGGVVILRYATTIKDTRIKKLITISSPIRGTKMTELLPIDSITHRELGFKSKLSKDLAGANINVPLYHIVPKWDHIIYPTSSARHTKTPRKNIYKYKGIYSHTGIIYDQDVINRIADWISD